jgi:hypothetical protein
VPGQPFKLVNLAFSAECHERGEVFSGDVAQVPWCGVLFKAFPDDESAWEGGQCPSADVGHRHVGVFVVKVCIELCDQLRAPLR